MKDSHYWKHYNDLTCWNVQKEKGGISLMLSQSLYSTWPLCIKKYIELQTFSLWKIQPCRQPLLVALWTLYPLLLFEDNDGFRAKPQTDEHQGWGLFLLSIIIHICLCSFLFQFCRQLRTYFTQHLSCVASKEAPHNQTKWIILTAMCIWQLLTRSQGACVKQRDGFQQSVTLTPKTRGEISRVSSLYRWRRPAKRSAVTQRPLSRARGIVMSMQTQLVPTWLETLQMRPLHSLSEGRSQTLQPVYDVRRGTGSHICFTKVTKGQTGRGGYEGKWDGRNERAKVIKEGESTRRPLWAVLATWFPSGKCDIPQPEGQTRPSIEENEWEGNDQQGAGSA